MIGTKSKYCPYETDVSREIRILSEVEKIFIIFDEDNSGTIDKEEVKNYVRFIVGDRLTINESQLDQVYGLIDTDNDESIDRNEMALFLKTLMCLQKDVKFKQSKEYLNLKEDI